MEAQHGRVTLSEPDDIPKGTARPSALLQNLARIAAHASGACRKDQGTLGAASAGKRLTSWTCTCGWAGAAKELRIGTGGLSCPSCDKAGGLTSA